jgi:site-specific recombinase XerD
MATVRFYLQSRSDSAPIYCRFSHGRDLNIKVRTGQSCNPDSWSKLKGLPSERDANFKKLRAQLNTLSAEIINQFNDANSKGIVADKFWLQSVIDVYFGKAKPKHTEGLVEVAQHYIENLPFTVSSNGKKVGVAKATIGKYKNILRLIVEFEKFKSKRYAVKDVNSAFRSQFIKFLTDEKGLTSNTVGRYIKFLKTFAFSARSRGIEISDQVNDFKGYTLKIPKITLSEAELTILRNLKFASDRLTIARDWFIIGCYTGQRVSDLLRMNSSMIKQMEGFMFIELEQVKTKKMVQIPVHREVSAILNRYMGNFPPKLTDNISAAATELNRYLKVICRQAGFTQQTKGFLRDLKTGEYKEGMYEKWQLITTHTCRRSFATNFYGLESYPTPLLMNVTGHATEKQFLDYIGKNPIDYSIQLAKIWAKEAESNSKGDQFTPAVNY